MMMKFFLRIHTVSHDEYTVKSIQLVSNSPFLVQLFVETYTRVLKIGRSDDAITQTLIALIIIFHLLSLIVNQLLTTSVFLLLLH